jgi:hypothetical protein
MLMNIRNIFSTALILPLLAAVSSHAAEAPMSGYRLDMTISRNGSLVGKPAIVVGPGAQAELRDENPKKPDDGFRILVTASPLADAPNGKESIRLQLQFFGRLQGKWIERGNNSITALVGKNVSFAFPSKPPEATGKDYELVITTSRGAQAGSRAK